MSETESSIFIMYLFMMYNTNKKILLYKLSKFSFDIN